MTTLAWLVTGHGVRGLPKLNARATGRVRLWESRTWTLARGGRLPDGLPPAVLTAFTLEKMEGRGAAFAGCGFPKLSCTAARAASGRL
jgi:hypothetical protein